MRLLLVYFLVNISLLEFLAQVPKKIVVEHFTNTRCSICASRNPGFYTNLNNQSNTIHLAIHPSAPYPTCVLNQHNVAENDARTNYYGIYSFTPRLVINGSVISTSADHGDNAIFTPFTGQNSPVSIKIYQSKYAGDSIRSRVVIKTETAHTLNNQKLFVALAEDTLFYVSPNGESRHYDVFRKSLTGATGVALTIPALAGDSVSYSMSSPSNSAWNFSRIYTIAILQNDNTKEVTQSELVNAKSNTVMSIKSANTNDELVVFAPAGGGKTIFIRQTDRDQELTFELYDLTGRKILSETLRPENEFIQVPGLANGAYIYSVRSKHTVVKTGKLLLN